MKIGKIGIAGNLVLAPMADVTNRAFRVLCRRHGASYAITEMVNADAIVYGDAGAMGRAQKTEEEVSYGIQLFGNNPKVMGMAASILNDTFHPSTIDINFGCPSPLVRRSGAGSALLHTPDKIGSIVRYVSDVVDIPVTAKIRILKNIEKTLRIAETIESEGACAIAVHARTAEMGYSGVADHEYTRRICDTVSIPVIANGDIRDGPKAAEVLEYTGCDGIMIGRAAMGDPDVFRRIQHYLNTGEIASPPDCAERLECLAEYFRLLEEFDLTGHVNLQAHAGWFTKGLSSAKKMRGSILGAKNPLSILNNLKKNCLQQHEE